MYSNGRNHNNGTHKKGNEIQKFQRWLQLQSFITCSFEGNVLSLV